MRARGDRRRARSDWMAIEQQRGISVTSSVMTFERSGILFNLLDTPGHQDFSEDTYRTLTAVDSAIMVIDAAKGIEAQTRKLFEVCRLRNIPIVTFVNKVDREGLSPFALLDEIAETLQLDVCPRNWPVGMGGLFHGLYDLADHRLLLADRSDGIAPAEVVDARRPRRSRARPAPARRRRRPSARGSGPGARRLSANGISGAFLAGDLTPVFFGSALREFGTGELLDGLAAFAPPPGAQPARSGPVSPDAPRCSGFVFKVQANMDPNHRDRIAFLRICSGSLRRGMKLANPRLGKSISIQNPITFFARDRELAELARPGDIVGIPNHGTLEGRRHALRERRHRLHRPARFRARDPAPGPARRSDEVEADAPRPPGPRRGGGGPDLQAGDRHAAGSSASSARSSSTSWRPGWRRNMGSSWASSRAPGRSPAGSAADPAQMKRLGRCPSPEPGRGCRRRRRPAHPQRLGAGPIPAGLARRRLRRDPGTALAPVSR